MLDVTREDVEGTGEGIFRQELGAPSTDPKKPPENPANAVEDGASVKAFSHSSELAVSPGRANPSVIGPLAGGRLAPLPP